SAFLFLLKSNSKSTRNNTKNRERVLPRVKSTTTSKFKIEKTESLWWRNSRSNQLTSLASSEIWLRQRLISAANCRTKSGQCNSQWALLKQQKYRWRPIMIIGRT
ncbi:hypothetical protein BpHYR1_040544, partial [Brachionus plicatilis]